MQCLFTSFCLSSTFSIWILVWHRNLPILGLAALVTSASAPPCLDPDADWSSWARRGSAHDADREVLGFFWCRQMVIKIIGDDDSSVLCQQHDAVSQLWQNRPHTV